MIPETSSSAAPKTPPAAEGDGFDPDYFPEPKKKSTKKKVTKAKGKKMPYGPERPPEKKDNKLFALRRIKQIDGQPANKLTMNNRLYADQNGDIHERHKLMSFIKKISEHKKVSLGIRVGSYALGGLGAAYYAAKGDLKKAGIAIGGSGAVSESIIQGTPTMVNKLKKATGGGTAIDGPKFSFRKTSAKTFVSEYMDRNPKWVCLVNELLNAVKNPPISEKHTQISEHTIFQLSITLTCRLDASNKKVLEFRAEATERGNEKETTRYLFTLDLEGDHANLKELLTEEKLVQVPEKATLPDGKVSKDTRSPELIREAQAILTEPTSNYDKLKKASDTSLDLMLAVFDTMEQSMSKTEVKDMVHRALGRHAAVHSAFIGFIDYFAVRIYEYLSPSFKKELKADIDSKKDITHTRKTIIKHTYQYFTENLTDASLKEDCGYYPDNGSWRPWHLDVDKFISHYRFYSKCTSDIFKYTVYVLEQQCLFLIHSLELDFNPHATILSDHTVVDFLYLQGSHASIRLMQKLFNAPKPKKGLKPLSWKEFEKRYDRHENVIDMDPPDNCSIM